MKGYITNTDLPAAEVISQYHGLWVVERAFRIGKGTLEMRPMFHFTEKRIEAHICICFVAYKVYKELERVIRGLDMKMSVDKVLAIAKTIITLRIRLPNGSAYTERSIRRPNRRASNHCWKLSHATRARRVTHCQSRENSGRNREAVVGRLDVGADAALPA